MSENERKFATTTISTIAIHSGKTRIVIALLQSGDLLELKIVELVPDLTLLGETFEEASDLENAHEHVLQQLQNKQSPVEELLKKADQVIADQKPQAEVYAAMADSLGQAWKDINSYLMLRKRILQLNVTYHSKAEACVERMRVLELLCLSQMPSNEDTLRENLECMQEVKKSMLECLMGALQAGQSLLSALNELAAEGSIDSRTKFTKRAALSAIAQVDKWMEELHNRRRMLDVTWQRRKLNLEKYRTISVLKCDLDLLEGLLKERCRALSRHKHQLGRTPSEVEELLTEHLQLFSEAKNLQEESLRMVKASEKLPSSSHKFSEESNKISYNILSLANEYVQAVNDREEVLKKSIHFFNTAKSVILKLEEMNYQLKNVNSTSERLIIMNMTEEITKEIINEGHWILEYAPDAQGVTCALNRIENSKQNIISYCTKENQENIEVSQVMNNFYEKCSQICSCTFTAVENVIQRHQDMGNGLQSAKDFLNLHEKQLHDLKVKTAEIVDISGLVPPQVIDRLQVNTKEDLAKKVQLITKRYHSYKKTLEERIRLSLKYVEFHSLAVSLENELDSFARCLSFTDSVEVLKFVEQASLKIKELHSQLVTVAEDFLNASSQVQESYLDAKRAQFCVESVLEHFANRKSDIEEKWNIWERSALDKETSQALWFKNMVDSENELGKYVGSDIHAVNDIVENKQLEWDSSSANPDQVFKLLQIQKQFDQDLEKINTSIRELSGELPCLQYQYSFSLSAAKSALLAFQCYEKTIQILETKIEAFLNTTEEVLKTNESKFDKIEDQIDHLKDRWNKFCAQVTGIRHSIDLSIRYFTLIEETEECFREGTKLLVCIARKSSTVHTAEEAGELLNDIQDFLNSLEFKMEERIKDISSLAIQLFNDDEHSRQVSRVIAENNDMLDSFQVVSKELTTLHTKLMPPCASGFIEPSSKKTIALEVVSVENLPTASGIETVEVVQVLDNEACIPEPEITVNRNISPSAMFENVEPVKQLQAPVFVSTLTDVRVPESSKFIFQCEVKGNPTPEIMWYKDELPVEKNPDYQTTFCDGICKLCIEEVFVEDSARYMCRAVNESGTAETLAVLSVVENDKEHELCPPTFLINLSDLNIKEKEMCELCCKVSGNPLPVVQWFREGICVDNHPYYEITYNNGDAKLFIQKVTLEDSSAYTCTAINPLGRLSSSCLVNVSGRSTSDELPAFSTCLSNVMVRAGQKLKLECSVTGNPFPNLSWYHNGKLLKELPNIIVSVDDSGNVVLIILEAFPKDAGSYMLVASNAAGETSCSCNVSVKGKLPCETSDSEISSDTEPIRPSINYSLADVTVKEGTESVLECVIVGQPEPEVIWYHNDIPVKEGDRIRLYFKGDKCSLHIRETLKNDAGVYKVVAINSAGEISSTCQLHVPANEYAENYEEKDLSPPKFNKLLTDILIREGDTAVLECSVVGVPKPDVKWFLNSSEINCDERVKGEKHEDGNITLTIQNITPGDKGLYTARASNSLGEAKCFSHVIIKSLQSANLKSCDVHLEDKFETPAFTKLFADKVVTEGEPAKFECIVKGKPAPKVKWLFESEPVSGKSFLVSTSGDRQVLCIPQVSQENAGVISCVAENDVGKASCIAHLQVTDSISLDEVLPTLDTLKVFESSKSYEVKKTSFTKSVAFNNESPVSKTDSYLHVSEEATQKLNDGESIKTASHHMEEKHEMDGKQADHSSHSFTSGNIDVQKQIQFSKQDGVALLRPVRKQIAPRFLSPLNGAIVNPGTDVKFEAVVESYPEANITWHKNNVKLPNNLNNSRITWELNRATVEIFNVEASDSGRYTCSASNAAGTASSSADLFVKKTAFPPVMGKRLHPQSIDVGKRIIFEIEVTGTPTPFVTWFKNDVQLPRTSPFYRLREQGTSHALIFEKARLEDSGQYKVKAHNEAGEAFSLAELHVFEPPTSISENAKFSMSNIEISSSFSDDTKIYSTSRRSDISTFAPAPSRLKSSKSDFRKIDYENDYDNRIPPIWRPSESDPDEPCYRPVRPNLTPVQRPFYKRSMSAEVANEFKSKSNVEEAKDRRCNRSYSTESDRRCTNEVFQKQVRQTPTGHEGNYEELHSMSEASNQSSKFTEVTKIQKVEEIRKQFENINSFSNESFSFTASEDSTDDVNSYRSRIHSDSPVKAVSMHNSETVQSSYKTKSQQFIDNIVNNVNNKQNELKLQALTSPSLYSPSIVNEPQIFKDHHSNSEHVSSNESGWSSELTRSTEADYVIVNESGFLEKEDSHQTVPVFSTPLHDIAAVTGSKAKFECIVQSDSPFSVEWRKDDAVLQKSELCQINFRNGVCTLTLLKTYTYDAGIYHCMAMNKAGFAETSATLVVSGERRSYIKK